LNHFFTCDDRLRRQAKHISKRFKADWGDYKRKALFAGKTVEQIVDEIEQVRQPG